MGQAACQDVLLWHPALPLPGSSMVVPSLRGQGARTSLWHPEEQEVCCNSLRCPGEQTKQKHHVWPWRLDPDLTFVRLGTEWVSEGYAQDRVLQKQCDGNFHVTDVLLPSCIWTKSCSCCTSSTSTALWLTGWQQFPISCYSEQAEGGSEALISKWSL